jgi:exosortase
VSKRLPQLGPRAWLVAAGALAAVAFRALPGFEPRRDIPDAVERMLFEPADTSPAVVLVLALWLVFRRRERWRALPGACAPLALWAPLLAAGLAVFAWSRLTGAIDLLVPALLASGLGVAALLKGAAGLRALALPAAFLLFALPLPPALANGLIYRFQLWTAELAGRLLFWFGAPAHVAGETILRADYTFSVVEGCSGLRSVVTLAMLAVLMVDLFRRSGLHAWLLVLAAPVVAFGFNAVRAVALILNPHSAIASVHVAQGIAILLAGLLVLFAFDGLLERLLGRPRARAPQAAAPGARPPAPRAALAYLALLALLSVAVRPFPTFDVLPLALETRYAHSLGAWRGEPLQSDGLFLGSVAFREKLLARYRRGRDSLDLFLGVGDLSRRFGSALSAKTALPGSGWVIEERWRTPAGSNGRVAEALLIRSGPRWRLVHHWTEASRAPWIEALRSLLALDATPWRRPRDPLVVRLVTDLAGPGPEERERGAARLAAFTERLEPELAAMLRLMETGAKAQRGKDLS